MELKCNMFRHMNKKYIELTDIIEILLEFGAMETEDTKQRISTLIRDLLNHNKNF